MALLASFSWAFAAILYRKALFKSTNPLITNCLRTPIAILVLFCILILSGNLATFLASIYEPNIILVLLIATIIMNIIGDTLYLISIRDVGVSIAYPLSYTYPIMVALIASIILKEKINIFLIFGTVLGILGVWLISQKTSNGNKISSSNFIIGISSAIGASFSWSVGIVIFRIAVSNADPINVGTIKLLLLFMLSSPSIILKHEDVKKTIDKRTLMFAMVGGIFGVGIGDWFFYISLASVGAAIAAALTTSAPLLSVILAYLILKEKIVKKQIIGTILIVIGVLIISLKSLA